MSLVEHAREELKRLRDVDEPDDMQDVIEKNILEIIETFSKQGHSGFSSSYCIPIINSLLKFEPITPLTGEEDEWCEISDGIFQNKRLSTVFKDKNRFEGKPYWLDGKIFSNDNGLSWYTNSNSCVLVEFPFMPREPEKIFVKESLKEASEELSL